MIVAVIAMRVMKVPAHEIVDVVAVRHRFVPASGAVDVPVLVAPAMMLRRAPVRVLRADFEAVLVHMAAMRVVQVAVVQVIDVAVVPDRGMAAIGSVLVVVVGVVRLVAGTHAQAPHRRKDRRQPGRQPRPKRSGLQP
ncbi:hypothetical protein ACKI2N_034175 [Cupriavidus sp. 30B13]|uniref:hypothetical protein n=1 Tax=Cupriavidus sp. 30B13 TaxID=3384241 RepID=UPI003B8F18E2